MPYTNTVMSKILFHIKKRYMLCIGILLIVSLSCFLFYAKNKDDRISTIQNTAIKAVYKKPIEAKKRVAFTFTIYNLDNATQVTSFDKLQGKLMHLLIVDSELKYVDYQYPELHNGVFTDSLRFPKNGKYYLYLNFQPTEGVEQQETVPVLVGTSYNVTGSFHKPDTILTKNVESYQITLDAPEVLSATKLAKGEQKLTFIITDNSGNPITNLTSYFGSFGHMVMINKETYRYLHINPETIATEDEIGGPDVSFYTMGIGKPITPGIYRIFAQFNPNNEILNVDFTIKVNK